MKDRKYDIVLLGATGFTGNYVARYLATYAIQENINWAIAGRNVEKLKTLAEEMGANELPIIYADINDPESLDKMASSTKVVCTTVGPFAKFGTPVVDACVKARTHYCDITGETHWIKKIIDLYHNKAVESGVKIVHCCGFDSIPSDLGVSFVQKHAKEKFGEYCHSVKMRVRVLKGKFSGGTYTSMSNILEEAAKDKEIRKTLRDPYSLNPTDAPRGPEQRDLHKVVYEKESKSWIAPFIMEAINTRIVRRSHALKGHPYGVDFVYNEGVMTGDGWKGRIKGIMMTLPLALMMAAKPGGMLKKVLNRYLPKPGEGPTEKEVREGFYILLFFGRTPNGHTIKAKWKGDQDPGYGSTSKMLAHSAICLARDTTKLPEIFGVLTPSTAMGEVLLNRLVTHAGIQMEVVE